MKKYIKLFALIALTATVIGCSNKKEASEESSEESVEQKVELNPVDQVANLSGTIGRAGGVHMTLTIKGEDVEGTYYYDKMGSDHILDVRGTLKEDGLMELYETNKDGKQTGHFLGFYGKEFGFKGNFANAKGTISKFDIKVDNVEDKAGDGEGRGFLSNLSEEPTEYPEVSVPVNYEEEYDDYSGDYSDDSGSGDWDALLDAYENCVDQLIRLSEKAVRGDASAVVEYGNYMRKYEEFARKVEQVDQGSMSTAQMNRLNRINNKYLKAAQRMM